MQNNTNYTSKLIIYVHDTYKHIKGGFCTNKKLHMACGQTLGHNIAQFGVVKFRI